MHADFAAFWTEWSDYVLSLNPDVEDDLEAMYMRTRQQLSNVAVNPIWRGFSACADWVNKWKTSPLGIYWSQCKSTANDFCSAVSIYDERFASLEASSRPRKVLLKALVPQDSIDLSASIAVQLASSESEIRLKPGAPVHILEIQVDGIPIPATTQSAFA
jgi:hypothetical protein